MNNFYIKVGKNYFDDGKNGNGITTNALASNNIINTLGNTNRMLVNANTDTSSHYAIEPAEDDGIDDGLTARHLAAIRFNRNHRLINEIFSEYTIPDNRSIVTSQRMEQLKKQVHSLEQHQEKLKQELLLIEEKNEAKKKKILNASADFEKELSKVSKNLNLIFIQFSSNKVRYPFEMLKKWLLLTQEMLEPSRIVTFFLCRLYRFASNVPYRNVPFYIKNS